jgi:hypothetical protein
LGRLHIIGAYGDWFGELRRAVDNATGYQAEIAKLAEERERTCLCVDENEEYSEAIRRYREILDNKPLIEASEKDRSAIQKFEKWKQILEGYEALRPQPSFITPSVETEINGYGCRDTADGIFVKVAVGSDGYLVSEGGIEGKCRRDHEWSACPTAQCLFRVRPGKVLCAKDVLNRLKDRRRRLADLVGTWRSESA